MIYESEIVKDIQKDKHIRYFKLPEDNGWNSGRAVLISQVQTEYFVTCDDDFVFNSATRTRIYTFWALRAPSSGQSELFGKSLEAFLEVIENTGFDVIGGGVGKSFEVGPTNSFFSNWLNFGKYKVTKGASGDCISREFGFHGQGLTHLET